MDYSKPHTLEEWIAFYEEKTQDKFECPAGFNFLWMPYRGFTVFKPDKEMGIFLIYLTCGDGHFWYDVCEMIALQSGYTKLMTICTRKIKPYIRFWHWRIENEQEVNGQKRFFCKDELNRNVLITHRGVDEKSGIATYYVTKYLMQGEGPDLDVEQKG